MGAEDLEFDRIGCEVLIRSAVGNFTEEVNIAERSNKRGIQASLEGRAIPDEREAWWRPTKVRFDISQGSKQSVEVFRRTPVHDIQILSQPRRTVCDRGRPANHD